MTTFTEASNAARHKASRFAKEAQTMDHSAHRTDTLTRNTIPSSPSLVEFAIQREHGIPNDTIRPESVEFGMPRNHTKHHETIRLEAGDIATKTAFSTLDGTIHPESVEFGTRRKHTNQYCAKSSVPANIANERNHVAPYDTIRSESVELGARRKHCSPHGSKRPKAVDITIKRNQATLNHTIHPESFDVGTRRKHTKQLGNKSSESVEIGMPRYHTAQHGAISPEAVEVSPERKLATPQGIASPESAEFGTQRKQANPSGTSRSVYVDSGSSRSHPNTHVANSPEETYIYQEETDIIPSTEAEYSATETNPSNFNHLPSESATVALDVPDQVDNLSADKTGEQQKKAGEKHGSSDTSDDDSELREFFRCKICVSGRIRCWMLNPCHHLVCFNCKQKMPICPFCRTPIKDCMKIRYGFQ